MLELEWHEITVSNTSVVASSIISLLCLFIALVSDEYFKPVFASTQL